MKMTRFLVKSTSRDIWNPNPSTYWEAIAGLAVTGTNDRIVRALNRRVNAEKRRRWYPPEKQIAHPFSVAALSRRDKHPELLLLMNSLLLGCCCLLQSFEIKTEKNKPILRKIKGDPVCSFRSFKLYTLKNHPLLFTEIKLAPNF